MIDLSDICRTIRLACVCSVATAILLFAVTPLHAQPAPSPPAGGEVLSLTVNEAMALFLRQNLDLLMAQYGIDYAKGLEVTAKLFPNPILSLEGTGSLTRPINKVGALTTRVDQLFELAGKRGYRQESSRYGTQSAEAAFADAVRTLGFSVKEAFYKVLLTKRKLDLAQDNSTRFAEVVRINTIRFQKGVIAEADLIKLRVQFVDFQNQVITATHELFTAQNTLKGLLAVRPQVELVLNGELEYKPQDLALDRLRTDALSTRPDVAAKDRTLSQRSAELKLAEALRVPDVTVGADFTVQGPQGPNTEHQVGVGLSVPLPLFNRNQGGILQAEASRRAAQADLDRTKLQVEIDVENAYRDFTQTDMLAKAYRGGVLDDARTSREIAEKAYARGGMTILDLLDAFRTFNTTMQGYIDALYAYQRSLLAIDTAVGREATK